MEAIALLKEAEQMIKELQDAYVHHDGAVALRRKIRKLIASQQSVQAMAETDELEEVLSQLDPHVAEYVRESRRA